MNSQSVMPREKISGATIFFICCCSFFGIIFVFVFLFGTAPYRQSTSEGTKYSAGSIGWLYSDKSNIVFISVDEVSMWELIRAAKINDVYGLLDLIRAGKLIEAKNWTKVMILDVITGKYEGMYRIRCLDGSNAGRAGYIMHEYFTADSSAR